LHRKIISSDSGYVLSNTMADMGMCRITVRAPFGNTVKETVCKMDAGMHALDVPVTGLAEIHLY
jgi:hypothetical protein